MDGVKPSLDEVLAYAQGNIRKFIGQFAADAPEEQQDEIVQTANLRIIEAYRRLEADLGWKSFVHNHCRGAVLDYLKFGKGFEENRWRLKLSDDPNAKFVDKLRDRISYASEDQEHDVDTVAGVYGVASYISESAIKINWDLVARLARTNDSVHAFAMWVLGFEAIEIGAVLGVCSARVGQHIRDFCEMVNSPDKYSFAEEPFVNQAIFAFGLSKYFGLPEIDESLRCGITIGWEQEPVDLESLQPKYGPKADTQMAWNFLEADDAS